METFISFHWVMQEIGWNGLDGAAVLQLLLILIRSLQPLTNLTSHVTLVNSTPTGIMHIICVFSLIRDASFTADLRSLLYVN